MILNVMCYKMRGLKLFLHISEAKRGAENVRRMERKELEARQKPSFGVRLARAVLVVFICAAAAAFYLAWLNQTKAVSMPPMVMPQPYFYEEEQPVRAVLLWRETVLKTPAGGAVQFAHGGKAAAVASGDPVASVFSHGKNRNIAAPRRGYFVPGHDGAEDKWEYSSLWPGAGLLPRAPQLNWLENMSSVAAGKPVGKLIDLPQRPRAIFYFNITDLLAKQLERGYIYIRKISKGAKWYSRVRVYSIFGGQKVKAAVEMPYFTLDMASSRETEFLVCSDEGYGLAVPESAVVLRDGAFGVFELVGDTLKFRKITGKPLKDGMFFVATGLEHGNPVILHAAGTEERRVQLW